MGRTNVEIGISADISGLASKVREAQSLLSSLAQLDAGGSLHNAVASAQTTNLPAIYTGGVPATTQTGMRQGGALDVASNKNYQNSVVSLLQRIVAHWEGGRAGTGGDAEAADAQSATEATGGTQAQNQANQKKAKLDDFSKLFSAEKITSGILQSLQTGVNTYFRNLDKTSLIQKAGSGDFLGLQAELAERWSQNESSIGSIVGGGAGLLLGGVFGGAAGATIMQKIGSKIGEWVGLGSRQEATNIQNAKAYASLWQEEMQGAMQTSATYRANDVRGLWRRNAAAANAWGYSAQEGTALAGDLAKYGLSAKEGTAAVAEIMKYQRGTGADRGALAEGYGTFAKYGDKEALKNANKGLAASGMEAGQFSEFLRAMQKTFEDGISKGFTKSSKDVAKDLSYVAKIGGERKEWQGESGAQKLAQINAGLKSAAALNTTSDMRTFIAVNENLTDKEREAALAKAGVRSTGNRRLDTQIIIEGGGATVINAVAKGIYRDARGKQSTMADLANEQYGFGSKTAATQFVQGWLDLQKKSGGNATDKEIEAIFKSAKQTALEENNPELKYLREMQTEVTKFKTDSIAVFDSTSKQFLDSVQQARNEMNSIFSGIKFPSGVVATPTEKQKQVFNDSEKIAKSEFFQTESEKALSAAVSDFALKKVEYGEITSDMPAKERKNTTKNYNKAETKAKQAAARYLNATGLFGYAPDDQKDFEALQALMVKSPDFTQNFMSTYSALKNTQGSEGKIAEANQKDSLRSFIKEGDIDNILKTLQNFTDALNRELDTAGTGGRR